MKNLPSIFSLFAVVLLVFSGCARPVSKCVSPEDNPPHHYVAGMELLEQNKLDEAGEKFNRALYCDGSYGPGYAGLAIVTAMKARAASADGFKQADVDRAFEQLESAESKASTNEDDFAYRLASMRVHTVLKPTRKWLDHVEADYKKVMKLKLDEKKLLYYEGREAAIYFMGVAYLDAKDFQSARDRFSEVLSEKKEGKWNALADRGWKKTDKIVRALGGITLGDVGKEIALKDSVKRAEMAALLIDELKIDKLFAGRIPVKSEADRKTEFTPMDVAASPFKAEVLTVLKWGVRGMDASYDPSSRAYLFRPDEPVSRKDFAFTLEDVLIKITGDQKMSSAFFGHDRSPFPDVKPTAAWYNAVMNVTTRNIMETDISGEFRPDDNVDGADAILAVRVLKQRLNIY